MCGCKKKAMHRRNLAPRATPDGPSRHDDRFALRRAHAHAPRRLDTHRPLRHAAARRGGVHRRGSPARGGRRRAERRRAGSHDAAARERRVSRAHGEGRALARRAASLGRASARDRCAPPAPQGGDRIRSVHRGWVLLRLRGGGAVHAGRPREDRGGDAPRREREISVRARGGESRARRRQKFVGRSAQARAALRARRRRGDLRLHGRTVHRSLPRAARAGHVAHQALQAAAHRRRVLARR